VTSFPRVCLVVLDGWALAEPGPGNAVELADTPVFDELWERHPHTTLVTHGPAVGLPEGQMGNSEVGHLNLGAGAVVKQDLLRIDEAIEDGSFYENEALRAACRTERLHLLGLVSDGGVHSSMEHLRALIELAARQNVPEVVVHAFTDGRDTAPDSGVRHLAEVESWGGSRIATVSGRYYAMDRDRRWDRTARAFNAIVEGEAEFSASSGEEAVRAAYERGETDEFIKPTLVGDEGRIREGDSVIFFNFRPDRARQLTQKLGEAGFAVTTLTEYNEDWNYPIACPPARPAVTLASMLAERGEQQLHVAETEKYAHVTYFFNGGEEDEYAGEERRLVDSPRDVPTYDKKPEMSAREAAQAFTERWRAGDYTFGIINFANPDMVGHTGVIEAAVKAVETVDECLGQVVEAVHDSGGVCVITADHGNADHMLEPDGSPNTAHSKNPVPLIVTADVGELRGGGTLADVAPTILALLGEEQPPEMTGRGLTPSSKMH
jgi:2,3-bisphosphoglycerate-independent phosphoglycerate mutase